MPIVKLLNQETVLSLMTDEYPDYKISEHDTPETVTEAVAEGIDEDLDEGCECQSCGKVINLYEEAAFIVGIYVDDVREEQQRWCKTCAVEGMNMK